jgi:hypothetical protein
MRGFIPFLFVFLPWSFTSSLCADVDHFDNGRIGLDIGADKNSKFPVVEYVILSRRTERRSLPARLHSNASQ